jgi:hypothetical protein
MYDIQHCFICSPSDSNVSEDAGIEPRTVATTVLAFRLSNNAAISHPQRGYISSKRGYISSIGGISHPQRGYISSTARLYLIHTRLCLISTTRLYRIHNEAISHPHAVNLQYISLCCHEPHNCHSFPI